MISHEDEVQMNGAFANIKLIASKVWAHDQEDKYRKLNQSLCIQNRKLSETYNGKGGKRTRVRDVIPGSRLAQYGNYEYSLERERLYNFDVSEGRSLDERENKNSWYKDYSNGGRFEPWMFKQVDECFVRLMSLPTGAFFTLAKVQEFGDDESGQYMEFPCAIEVDHEDELQLRARICSKLVKDLWSPCNHRLHCDGQSQTRSSLTNFYEPRIFEAPAVSQHQQQEEKNTKMRRYCTEKRAEVVRKSCHLQSNSYALRNCDRTLGVIDKRSSLFCPVVTMSSPIVTSRPSIVPAILCPEVAEFFPKAQMINVIGDGERRVSSPIQFFPSSAEPSYKEELFPYDQRHFSSTSSTFTHNASGLAIAAVSHPARMNTWVGPNQWIQRIAAPIQIQVPTVPNNVNPGPTMYSSIQPFCTPPMPPLHHHHRPTANERFIVSSPGGGPVATSVAASGTTETAPIPVYQRPAELYQDSYSQRRAGNKSSQGVDYKNLILLTKSAMKARRNQSRNPRRASSFILESRQPNLKSETDVLRWLNKGYPKRAREFGTVNSLVTELSKFDGKCDLPKATEFGKLDDYEITIDDATDELLVDDDEDEDDSSLRVLPMLRKKRLYRDVLTNGGTSSDVLGGENILDKRYDELEQQAMEQYRTSEECLAMRYQELERQGLEQYRHGDGSSESIRAVCSATLGSGKSVKNGNTGDACGHDVYSGKTTDNDPPSSKDICPHDKAGTAMEGPIAILRSDAKYASVISNVRPRGFARQQQLPTNIQPTANLVTKSFTAFDRNPIRLDSKFPADGASGDKIEERGGTSLSFLRINLP